MRGAQLRQAAVRVSAVHWVLPVTSESIGINPNQSESIRINRNQSESIGLIQINSDKF